MVTGLLRTLAPRRRAPALLLRALNDLLLERKVDAHYVSLLVLLWEPRERQLTLASAGASPPLLYRKGVVGEILLEGTPLGLLEDRDYDSHSQFLQPGDVVLLYSDGFQDQHNPQREEYGRTRLGDVLSRVAHKPAQAIVNAIFSDLDRFASGHPQFDDQTLVVLKVL